jgi:hypothetical protein
MPSDVTRCIRCGFDSQPPPPVKRTIQFSSLWIGITGVIAIVVLLFLGARPAPGRLRREVAELP